MTILVLAGIPHQLWVDALQLLILDILLLTLVSLFHVEHLFSKSTVLLHLSFEFTRHCKI